MGTRGFFSRATRSFVGHRPTRLRPQAKDVPRSEHAPIVIVIHSEHLKNSISPRNQSAKHPDSGCFGISGVVIGSALSKGWRSGPEAFRAGHFLRLDRNRKPRMTKPLELKVDLPSPKLCYMKNVLKK